MTTCQHINNLTRWAHRDKSASQAVCVKFKMLCYSRKQTAGPSDFTTGGPLLLMSSPCKRPIWSFCNISGRGWEFVCSWCGGMLDGEWLNGGSCMFWWPAGPECCGNEKKFDAVNGIWCIPRLKDSEGLIISPVAILSLSTSFFNASLKAASDRNWISI